MGFFLQVRELFGRKDNVTKYIERFVKLLDYDEKLRIEKAKLPCLKSFIKPMEKGKSRARNPTFYLINTSMKYHGLCPTKTLAVMLVSRAVRCRRQSGSNKLQTFDEVFVSEEFGGMFGALSFKTFGIYEADAETIARIAGALYERGETLSEIAQMLLLDASKILEKYGVELLEESMYITI